MVDTAELASRLATLEARVRTLEDTLAITELKHRYFRYLDTQQWDELRACFTDDVETAYEDGHYRFEGVDEAMRFLSESLSGLRAQGRIGLHLGHHPEIEISGDDTARGRWTLHAASLDESRGRVSRLQAFYEDEYARVEGEWRIRRTGYRSHAQASWAADDLRVARGGEADSRALNARARDAGRA